jgi:hypothetical protein
MVGLVRHRRTKGPAIDRPYLNHRATPRLYQYGLQIFEYPTLPGTVTPWTERLTNFVLEFTAMTLNLEIHPEARRTSTVAADSWILSKGA